jgi:hypothetical protein
MRKKSNPSRRRETEKRRRSTEAFKSKNRSVQAKYVRRRILRDPAFMLRRRISEQLRASLNGKRKAQRTFEMLGYTPDELRRHLERQFLRGMTWENASEWHIDHIRPVSSFDLSDPEQLRDCWSLPNLRPLWARDNIAKGAKRIALI